MTRQRQADEVPQWVRNFITRHWEQEPEERDEQASDNTYLLCPFDQDEVKAIIAGVYKLREENHLAIAVENRKSREAGHLVPDSGISSYNDPMLELLYFRNLLLTPLGRQQMQEAVVKRYGWEKWTEDPWGDSQKFYGWLGNIIADDKRTFWEIYEPLAIWAINETFGGRVWLASGTVLALIELDYSKMSEKDLITYTGIGAENFLWVKSYTGWDNFLRHYPAEPLPASLVNEKIIKLHPFLSLDAYRCFVASIYLWFFALAELGKRAKGHPELEAFLDYHTATDAQLAEVCKKLSPEGYRLPDVNRAWVKLNQALKKPLDAKERRYADVLERGDASTGESLLTGVNYWKSKPAEAVISGLKGQLSNSLVSTVEHDFNDAAGKAYRKHEITDSKIQAARVTDEGDATPFLDTISSPEPTPEELMLDKEPIDLKSLGLDLDKLLPKERWVMQDVYEGLNEGYDFGSKLGTSFSKRWGQDYDRNMKAYNRAKTKLKQP